MMKIVLVGAGSLQFGTKILGDIFSSSLLDGAEIVLNDINKKATNSVMHLAQQFISSNCLTHKIVVEPNLMTALRGAKFVIISIEVGDRFKLWDMDWQIPQQYGVQQVYGENGGPGGLFHSLRIIPPILEICQKIIDIAPKAIVFNYSNPMSRICTTVHRKFPELNFIGMCHEIASLERHLPSMLEQPLTNIKYRAAGLNHFSILTDVTYIDTGADAYPDVRARAEDYFSQMPGYSEILTAARKSGIAVETEGWMNIDTSHITNVRPWSDRWLFRDILERFGYLPITCDSHFGEYIQWAHEASDHRGVLDFYTYYRNYLGKVPPTIKAELHERAVPIIEGILTNSGYEEAAVNIPNNGLIKDLPGWIVVEIPAKVTAKGVQGIEMRLPKGIKGLLTNQIGIHEMTAEAILNQSRDLVVQALLVDPVVTVSKNIPDLVDNMIAEQSPWLDYLR